MSGRPAKRPRTDHYVVNVWERELGLLPNRNFSNRFSASEDLLRSLGLHKKHVKHKGCVNTVSFNADGDILLSGSDDKQVILWDWEIATVKLSFDSGHLYHIFHAKFMPFSNDRSIVTSGADKQVRYSKILESGQVETSLLGKHDGSVHKLAVDPGSPFSFYTCGEDGVVKHFDLRTRVATNLFTCKEAQAKFNLEFYLYAIAVDPRNPGLLAVAGMDEYARVYDIRSYRSEGWYNFTQPVDHFCPRRSCPAPCPSSTKTQERRTPQVYKEHKNRETVKGVNFFGPKCEYVVSGSDCGRIFIWRKKDGELLRAMEADKHVVNCIESHPHMPLMCSSGIETDIKVWTPGGTERHMSPGDAKQDSVSGNPRWFHGYNDDDDSDDESSDESSDDDVSAEEEENGEVDVEITNDDDEDGDEDEDEG